ncbi:MAG: organic hydroperoxide reductase OsmC/OhrA [Planctomycetota bacterium]|jgi:organic hydroperoxide reductase OsmC/OhrA
MQVALYVHPFDISALEDHGGLGRLRDLGIGELSMATSYHDGRWLTPWHPNRRVRFLEDGCVHFRPSGAYGLLQPQPSSEVSDLGPSPLERLCVAAPAAGMRVRAWTVFGHNTRLGVQHPELTVENAFGDRYPYALCPSQPAVQQFHQSLVRDLAAHDGLGSIELEALGQMGIQHSSHHDKKSFSPSGLLAFALSACFCSACLEMHQEVGSDGEAMRARVVAFVAAQTTDADAMAPLAVPRSDADLDTDQREWVESVLAARAETIAVLAEAVTAASGRCERAVQVHPDRWFTGSQLSVESAQAFSGGEERVLTCYGEGPAQIEALLGHEGMVETHGGKRRLCIWPKAPQFSCDEDLLKIKQLCAEHSIETVAMYHLGLLPWRTIERAAKILSS